jgi:membrane protein DedA with SNARE-associated domain
LTLERGFEKLREKAPQLLVLAIAAVLIVIVLLDTLEDTLIEGGTFTSTPLAMLLNTIVMFTRDVTVTVSSWGYGGIFLFMLLESSSLPIPSEVVLPFAGYLVSLGQLNLLPVILVSTLAGITGSLVDYYVGLRGMRVLAQRKTLGKFFFSETRLKTAENWFNKYGALVVFLSRLVPGFRTLVSFPAGALKMPLLKFTAYTTAGCALWNSFLTYAGLYVGKNWPEIAGASHYVIIAAVAIFIAVATYLIVRRRQTQTTSALHFNSTLSASLASYHD